MSLSTSFYSGKFNEDGFTEKSETFKQSDTAALRFWEEDKELTSYEFWEPRWKQDKEPHSLRYY